MVIVSHRIGFNLVDKEPTQKDVRILKILISISLVEKLLGPVDSLMVIVVGVVKDYDHMVIARLVWVSRNPTIKTDWFVVIGKH